MADIIRLQDYRNQGNGAREALLMAMIGIGVMGAGEVTHDMPPTELVDYLLASLWFHGFKLVPVEDGRADEPPLLA